MIKTIKSILAGVIVLALVFCCGWFLGSWHAGKTEPTPTPIVNPSDDSQNQVIVEIGGTGTTDAGNNKLKATIPAALQNDNKFIRIIDDLQKKIDDLLVKANSKIDKTMPVTGSVTAKFIDKKTNTDLGSETKPLTGTATVKGDADNLSVKMDFNSQLTFGVNVPKSESELKLWTIGTYYESCSDDSGWVCYGQRDFPWTINNKYTITPYVGMELGASNELIGGVSIPIEFKRFTLRAYGKVEFGDDNDSTLGAEVKW